MRDTPNRKTFSEWVKYNGMIEFDYDLCESAWNAATERAAKIVEGYPASLAMFHPAEIAKDIREGKT